MKTRKRHEFTKEELEKERTPVNFNDVPWRADICLIRKQIKEKKSKK